MSWSIRRVGDTAAVRTRLAEDFTAIKADASQSLWEHEAAVWMENQIAAAMSCKVAADYFPGSVAGWKVEASASFSPEGMLIVSLSVDRMPLEISR